MFSVISLALYLQAEHFLSRISIIYVCLSSPGLFSAFLLCDDRHHDLHQDVRRIAALLELAPTHHSRVVSVVTAV